MEIHTNITKEEAYKLMQEGHRISHDYFTDEEFLKMNGECIYDENNYCMGTKHDEFWSKIQKWETGWKTWGA